MKYRYFCTIFLALVFLSVLIANGSADANLYLYPPSAAYFSSLNIGDKFTVEIIAAADAPGVTLIAFTVIWTPESSVEFVHPASEGSSELAMTGFFPPTDSSRLSGIAPDGTSTEAIGNPGATPEIVVFTAPANNYTGTDSLARVTFRKLSASQPTFNLTNATAAQSESTWISVTSQTAYTDVDAGSAQMSGSMLPQATGVVVEIAGSDYPADVAGDVWTLDIRPIRPSLVVQPITVKAIQGDSLLTSVTTMDFIRSPGWYENAGDHSEHPGDSDGSRKTDLPDVVRLGQSYNTSVGDARYDFRSDFNTDGVVNLADLLILGLNYNR